MPRAHEYRDGASLLRRRSSAFADAATRYGAARIDELATGPIAAVHDESMVEIAAQLNEGSARLEQLALECDARAEVCESYAARVREWERLPIWERLLTDRPSPPTPWAEA